MLLKKNISNDSWAGLLLLFIWPIVSLFYGLKNYQSPISKYLIVVLYGHAAFFYYFDFKSDLDVVRHAERLKATASYEFSYITDRFTNLFASERHKPDLLQPILDFAISRFTTNHKVYFFILGIIMGCFLIAYLNKVYSFYQQKPTIYLWILFFLIFVIVPPYRVAGFRGIVAMLFFLFSIYKAQVEGQRKYNFLVLLSPLMHFGYLAVVPFYYLTLIVGTRFYIYFLMIIVAFLFKDTVPSYIGLFGVDVEGEFGNRIRGYTSEDYIETFNQSRSGVLSVVRYQMQWTVLALSVLFILLRKKIVAADIQTKKTFAMVFSFLALLTLVVNLEVVFVRFSIPFVLLSCLALCMLFSNPATEMSWVSKMVIVGIFSFNFVVMARKSIEFTGVEVLTPNLITSFFLDMDASILDLIK